MPCEYINTQKHCLEKKQEFSLYPEIRGFSSCLGTKRSLDGGVCQVPGLYTLTVLGSLVFFVFVMLQVGRAVLHQVWKEGLAMCAGAWQQPNISVLTKRQSGVAKRISAASDKQVEFLSLLSTFLSCLLLTNWYRWNSSRGILILYKVQWSFHKGKAEEKN